MQNKFRNDVNTNEPVFYPYNITVNKCKRSCNTNNSPYAKLCVPDTIKIINVEVFNLMSWSNQTKQIDCNNKQRWNGDKCICECKELIDKGMCDKGFIWNPSNCECECDKSCDIGEFLDYKSCSCRKRLIDKLVEECSKNIDENEMLYNETLNDILLDAILLNGYEKVCGSCTLYIVLFAVFLITSTVISSVFIYFYWCSKKNISNAYYWYKSELSDKLI